MKKNLSGSADGRPTKREVAISRARVAGYENDTRTFTRLLVESRVRRELLNAAWQEGAALQKRGTSEQVPMVCHSEIG